MKVVSLFDGCSTGLLCLNDVGIIPEIYISSEIDKNAIEISKKNHISKNVTRLGDVRNLSAKETDLDLLIGGSPCQGFSFAGKQLNFKDERSKLFFEYLRILEEGKFKNFLLENVNMKKEFRDVITGYLGVEPIQINSSLISAARRNRWYWTNIPNVTLPEEKNITFDDINTNDQNWLSNEYIDKVKNWKAQQDPIKSAILIGSKSKLPCLTARGYNQSHSGMVLITDDNKRYRYLTNNEAELAMTMPLNYTEGVKDKERAKILGNGWTRDVITHIFKNIKQ
jgi:site-specific DNA-cytosine methylase